MLFGMVNSGSIEEELLKVTNRGLITQSIAGLLGIVLAFLISVIDYHHFTKNWKVHTLIFYILTLSTFIFGVATADRPDAKRWLIVPGINVSIQPSEFLKISFVITLAYHIAKVHDKINNPSQILLLLLHCAIPVALIHIQGDDGTALLFVIMFVMMLFFAGVSRKYFIGLAGFGVAAIPILWFWVLDEFQKQRILSVLYPESADATGYYYQQYQAKIAVGSGGLTGKGVFSSEHVYVPEAHSDFIFTFISESVGFIGSIIVFAIIVVLCVKILYNIKISGDMEGKMICAGIFAMFAFPAIANIGMCLSLFPVMGNPLPFLSSGGSSLLANFVAIGVALSAYIHREELGPVYGPLPYRV